MKNKFILCCVALFSLLTINVNATQLVKEQKDLLDIAYEEGRIVGYPETIQAILLQESSALRYNRIGDEHLENKSYGVTQFQLSTARYMLEKLGFNNLSDDQIRVRLLINDGFSIWLCAEYFKYLRKQFEGEDYPWSKAVLAYNVGIGNVKKYGLSYDPNGYLQGVKNYIKSTVRPYNKKSREYRIKNKKKFDQTIVRLDVVKHEKI